VPKSFEAQRMNAKMLPGAKLTIRVLRVSTRSSAIRPKRIQCSMRISSAPSLPRPRASVIVILGRRTRRRAVNMVEMSDSTAARTTAMSKPVEEKILQKAKELCRRGGKAWSLDDFRQDVSGVTMFTRVADAADRNLYLRQARTMLEQNTGRR
jgi:hypothetical protein